MPISKLPSLGQQDKKCLKGSQKCVFFPCQISSKPALFKCLDKLDKIKWNNCFVWPHLVVCLDSYTKSELTVIWREIAVVLTFSNLMLLTLGGSLKLISHDMKIHTTFMTFINDLSTLVRKAVLVWKTITLQIFESSNIDHKYMYEYIRSRSTLLLNDK